MTEVDYKKHAIKDGVPEEWLEFVKDDDMITTQFFVDLYRKRKWLGRSLRFVDPFTERDDWKVLINYARDPSRGWLQYFGLYFGKDDFKEMKGFVEEINLLGSDLSNLIGVDYVEAKYDRVYESYTPDEIGIQWELVYDGGPPENFMHFNGNGLDRVKKSPVSREENKPLKIKYTHTHGFDWFC